MENNDIVERLRSVDASWNEIGEWCAIAADEIEKLRFLVETLKTPRVADPIAIRNLIDKMVDEQTNELKKQLAANQVKDGFKIMPKIPTGELALVGYSAIKEALETSKYPFKIDCYTEGYIAMVEAY